MSIPPIIKHVAALQCLLFSLVTNVGKRFFITTSVDMSSSSIGLLHYSLKGHRSCLKIHFMITVNVKSPANEMYGSINMIYIYMYVGTE